MLRDGEEPTQPARPEGAHADVVGDDFTVAPLDSPHAATHPVLSAFPGRGARKVRALGLVASALLVVAVAVGLVARATSDPGAAIATLLRFSPSASGATVASGVSAIYFSNGAPWGTLTVDGKRMPQADLTGYGMSFAGGKHHLVYQARYFPSLRCSFSVPRASGDTCPLDTSDVTIQFLRGKGLARAIDLGSTSATLQADQRAALTLLADTILARQSLAATIEPGDRYLDEQGRIVTASAPLQFRLGLALDRSGAPIASGAAVACAQFCPAPTFSTGPVVAGGGWSMGVSVAASWSIADASGRVITSASYEVAQQYPHTFLVNVGVELTPTGWRINGLETMTIQVVEAAATNRVFEAENGGIANGPEHFSVGSNPLEGCVMEENFSDQTSQLFWRFGALIAVDATAHQVFPSLPIATAREQEQVARIAAQAQLRDDSILPTS